MKKRRWLRWIFLTMVAVALVYIVVVVQTLFQEGSTTFNSAAQLNQSSLKNMVVHKRPFKAPSDSLLRGVHLHIMERVIWALDTIHGDDGDLAWRRRLALATVLNEHSVSLEEYRWMRSTLLRSLQSESTSSPKSRTDSINLARMRMIGPIIKDHLRPLMNNEDSEAL